MYFSNRSKLSKILSLIFVCVLMLSLFAGCKKESDETVPETTAGLGLNLSTGTTPTETEPAPTETEPMENMGTVIEQTNVRSTPSSQAVEMGFLYKGDRVQIIQQEDIVGHMWGRIKEPYDGWVSMKYIQMDNPEDATSGGSTETPAGSGNVTAPEAPETASEKGIVTRNGLNIRSEPNDTSKIEGSYNKGDVIYILEKQNGWGRTDKGWVSLDYVQMANGNGGTGTSTPSSGNGNTSVVARGIVRTEKLNIRASATTNSDGVGYLVYGDRVEILEKDGNWGRIDKGWIHLDYVYQDGTTGVKTGTGTVTATGGLRIRSGPGTNYDAVGGSYAQGEKITILEQFTYGTTTWGCTSKGWVSMAFVNMGGTTGGTTGGNNNTTGSNVATVNTGLYIREGAGTDYGIIGSYNAGDVVTILERSGDWGRTEEGWISLKYVTFNTTTGTGGTTATGKTGTVTTGLRIRSGPSQDYEAVGGLNAGDRVTILEESNGWGRIDAGWISLNYVTLD